MEFIAFWITLVEKGNLGGTHNELKVTLVEKI